MAMEMFVLSDTELHSAAEWQAAIDSEGYPLELSSDIQLTIHAGFLPAKLRGDLTGFEFDHVDSSEFMRENSNIEFGRYWKFVIAFRWIGDLNELQAACMAAAAYAAATNGVVLDDEETICTAAEMRQQVKQIVSDIPKLRMLMTNS